MPAAAGSRPASGATFAARRGAARPRRVGAPRARPPRRRVRAPPPPRPHRAPRPGRGAPSRRRGPRPHEQRRRVLGQHRVGATARAVTTSIAPRPAVHASARAWTTSALPSSGRSAARRGTRTCDRRSRRGRRTHRVAPPPGRAQGTRRPLPRSAMWRPVRSSGTASPARLSDTWTSTAAAGSRTAVIADGSSATATSTCSSCGGRRRARTTRSRARRAGSAFHVKRPRGALQQAPIGSPSARRASRPGPGASSPGARPRSLRGHRSRWALVACPHHALTLAFWRRTGRTEGPTTMSPSVPRETVESARPARTRDVPRLPGPPTWSAAALLSLGESATGGRAAQHGAAPVSPVARETSADRPSGRFT